MLHIVIVLVNLFVIIVLAADNSSTHEVPHTRSYWYVGGGYVRGTSGHVFTNQMYVEKLSPVCNNCNLKQYPIVFIHGQAQTGTVSYPSEPLLLSSSLLVPSRFPPCSSMLKNC